MQPTKASLEETFWSCVGAAGVFGVFASPACKLLTSKPQFSYTRVNYSLFNDCFHILKPLLNHIVKIPISSHQSYVWALFVILSFFCPHPFCSLPFLSFNFAPRWCLFFRGWLDYPYWNSCYPDFRSSTKSIRGKIQITPLFSAIHSGLLFAFCGCRGLRCY